jgi:hypothetical protein
LSMQRSALAPHGSRCAVIQGHPAEHTRVFSVARVLMEGGGGVGVLE